MSFVRGILQFCYDFIVGDDWKIAAAVVLALLSALALLLTGAAPRGAAPVVGAALLVATFVAAVRIDVRASGRR